MARARNAVIAGDFTGVDVKLDPAGLCLSGFTVEGYSVMRVDVNRSTVERYELVNDEHQRSVASGIARGLVGNALLGSLGMLAGAVSAKERGIYQIAVFFRDDGSRAAYCGKRSLLELDDKMYKKLVAACF